MKRLIKAMHCNPSSRRGKSGVGWDEKKHGNVGDVSERTRKSARVEGYQGNMQLSLAQLEGITVPRCDETQIV